MAHLTIRTKQLREFFRESAEYLIDQITLYLSNPSNLKNLLLSEFSRDTDLAILARSENVARLDKALTDLDAQVIAVPPFEAPLFIIQCL